MDAFEELVRNRITAALGREVPQLSEGEIRLERQPVLAADLLERLEKAVAASEGKLRLVSEAGLPDPVDIGTPVGEFPLTLHWGGRRWARELRFELDRADGRIRWQLHVDSRETVDGVLDPYAYTLDDIQDLIVRLIDAC